ncbi:hypothetical protein HG536_0A06620 [Torulaspora globosa]|uniref:Protein transport protein sec16 n=1 Tax=Torulaspora globosa TaxID=48254 RepID=A0A7G3ZBG1_9SACH|nr:uncharacterized protein HG536_0A06620 [Torulaspora globosa]QLL30847.1 hypothetical protein HG536_0A06620 [Torulaspora globosa]
MTPEAKRRKNQKKKQRQKQKKQAEKLAVEEPIIEQSQDDSVESADVLSQSVDESDMNTTTTTAPLENETENPDAAECKGSPEDMEIIRSLQIDRGISIQGQLEKKLSKEVTIIDDIPKNDSSDDVNIVEADHNVAVPSDAARRETDLPIESFKELESDPQSVEVNTYPDVLNTFTSSDSIEPEADTDRVESVATIAPKGNDATQGTITMTAVTPNNGEEANGESFGGSFQNADDESVSQMASQPAEQVHEHEEALESASDISVASSFIDQQPQALGEAENLSAGIPSEAEHSTRADNGADLSPGVNHEFGQATKMFPDNNSQTDEVMLFGVQNENMNSSNPSPSDDKQIEDLFMHDDESNEVMPWEAVSASETRDLELEKRMTPMDKTIGAPKPTKLEHLETSNKTIERNENNGKITTEDEPMQFKNISATALDEKSDDMLFRTQAPLLGQVDDHFIKAGEEKAFLQNELNSSEPVENLKQHQIIPKQEQNTDKLAAIFGADDTADDKFWLNEHSQIDRSSHVPQPENRPSEQEQGKTKTKFSFLQEDDDLLDEEDDGFLSSDGEESIAQTTNNESSGAFDADSVSHVAPTNERPSQPVEASDFTSSISSLPTDGARSRYEPVQYSKNQDSAPPHAGRSVPSQYGIATPQFALQTNLPAQPQNLGGNREAVEKINEEKKKSDAYDFPLDLFPEKKKIVHAKPVKIPTFVAGASQQGLDRITPGAVGQTDARRSIGNRSTFEAPLPKNPYASLVTPQSKVSTGYQMPIQGIIPPVPVSSSIAPAKSLQDNSPSVSSQYPAINPYMQISRSRGHSNASAGGRSSKGIDRAVPDTTPLPFPSASRKTSATKYAPTSPSQGSYQYAPGKGNGLNGSSMNPPHFGGLPNMNPEVNLQPVPYRGVSSTNAVTNPPLIPYGSLPSATTLPVQDFVLPALKVPDSLPPTNVLSPTSASTTRRFHARSNSSVYTPNQSEYTSKYAPTVHPQYQNSYPMPQQEVQDPNFPLTTGRSIRTGPPIDRPVPEASAFDKPVDNQALLHRQFPLMHWSASDKIVCAVPVETSPNSYIMGPGSSLQSLEVSHLESKIPGTNLLKSFPGPLIKNKVKKKDVDKWLEISLGDYADSSLEYTLLAILKLKLADSTGWKDISRCLYDSDELLSYLSQPLTDSKSKPVTPKLDGADQLKVLAYLQTGGREMALAIAMEKRDYAMALLIGSLMGKDKWTQVVETYLKNEFSVESNVSNFSTNLLSLMFQVFIGNSKRAVQEFYSDGAKGRWATENWRIVVAAVLNNIEVTCEKSMNYAVPPMINEFLVEYGVFLAQRGLSAEACIVFVIANLPLSSSPIADTSVKFEHIGGLLSLEGCIFSEIYEFVNCSDAKGYGSLYSHKLYHAFCLQEHGFFSAASRYVDHLTGVLKQLPKKDPATWQMARGLNELSSRLAGSSTGWLGKPTLSSVWGQLDKSFNKYIAGDDDSLIKKPQGKKVFDGFTPVTSRNSSMLNVNQYQFTPAHNQAQHSTFKPDQQVLLAAGTANPIENPVQGLVNKNPVSKSLTDHGPPTTSPYSVASSPQQPKYQRVHSTVSPAHFPLRRVQTEQAGGTNVTDLHPLKTGTEQIERKDSCIVKNETGYYPGTAAAPSASIGRSSPYYCSTPDLLQNRSLEPSDNLSPAEPQLGELSGNNHPSEPLDVHSAPQSNQNESSKMTSFNGAEDHKLLISDNEAPYKQENYSQVSVAGFEVMVEGRRKSASNEPLEGPAKDMVDTSDVNADRRMINYESDLTIGAAFSSTSHSGVYNHSHAPESLTAKLSESDIGAAGVSAFDSNGDMRQSKQESLGETVDRQMSNAGFVATDRFNDSSFDKQETVEGREGEVRQVAKEYSGSTTDVSSPSNARSETSVSGLINPYAPPLTSKSYEPHPRKEVSPFGDPANTNGYIADSQAYKREQVSVKAGEKPPLVISSPVERPAASASANRFDPIRPAEALTADIFEPVIKKSSASRAFAPLVVQSSEDQYDDMVEDESDDEDEEERRRQAEQEKRKKEEEEKKRKEKESAEAKKNKQKQDEKASGWFSWLKKDPNEKKPIKAKLGHKSTFYYDEKLKRWVNKDSSETEKEKMASPPPPPPVVKRMDNGPKTKPLPGPETQLKDTGGAILPKNPITGAPLKSLSTNSPDTGDKPAIPPTANHSGINLSGKKANGLDDLLSLTGNNGGASKRKRKPGRGYVNVMDNK